MRLFIAIDLPEEVKKYLRGLQEELAKISGAQFAFTHDFHVTLKFLGECSEKTREKIEDLLSSVKFPSFSASLGKFGFFGSQNSPRVLWVGLSVPDWLAKTTREIEDKISAFGYPQENRFVPHITLARCKKAKLVLQNIKIKPMEFSVSQFHLYESKLSTTGAIHLILKSFPL